MSEAGGSIAGATRRFRIKLSSPTFIGGRPIFSEFRLVTPVSRSRKHFQNIPQPATIWIDWAAGASSPTRQATPSGVGRSGELDPRKFSEPTILPRNQPKWRCTVLGSIRMPASQASYAGSSPVSRSMFSITCESVEVFDAFKTECGVPQNADNVNGGTRSPLAFFSVSRSSATAFRRGF